MSFLSWMIHIPQLIWAHIPSILMGPDSFANRPSFKPRHSDAVFLYVRMLGLKYS